MEESGVEPRGIIGYPADPHKKSGPFSDGLHKCDGEIATTPEELDAMMRNCFLKQNSIEGKIADFAFDQTTQGRSKFVEVLHMFFSPHMIPDGLTVGQARLLYLVALHFHDKPRNAINSQLSSEGRLQVRIVPHGGDLLPEEWQYSTMTEEMFIKGLEKFMNKNLANDGC